MQFNTNDRLVTRYTMPSDSLNSKKNRLLQLLQLQIKSKPTEDFRKILLIRCLLANIYTLLLLYSGVMIGMLLPLPMPVSFPTGTACGFIFLRGLRVLPGIFLGSWLAFMSVQDWLMAGVSAVCYTSYIGMLYAACLYYRCPSLIFYRRRDLKVFFFIALGCTSVYCAVSTLLLEPSWTSFFNQWLFNTFSHLNGILIFATAILMWDARGLEFTTWPQGQFLYLSIIILILVCIIAGMVVYQPACYLVLLLLASNKLFDLAKKNLLALISLILIITAINFSHYFNMTWLQQQTTLDLLALQAMILLLVINNRFRSF